MGGPLLSKAHDGFGVAFCTSVACILSIVAITWGPWSQTDMLISEERNVATYGAEGELSVAGSEDVWGAEYLSKCPDCIKVSKLTMTRSPSDWCVTLKQLVFQPWEFLSQMPEDGAHRRRISDVLTTHTNYTVWTNSSCLSEMGSSYLADNFCNATWTGLRSEACERAQTEIDEFPPSPNGTAFPYAFWRWVKLQCAMFDHVCAGTGSVIALHGAGVAFLVLAMIGSIAGPFLGSKYKLVLIATLALLVLSWLFLLLALLVFGEFNGAMNAPRDLYIKMLVHGEGTGETGILAADDPARTFGAVSPNYQNARLSPYTAYPALKPPGPIADYIGNVLATKPRWDWDRWTFSMGFFAGASAVLWVTVAAIFALYSLIPLLKLKLPPVGRQARVAGGAAEDGGADGL